MVIVECRSVFASILLFFYLSEVEEQPIHQLQDGNIEPHFMHQRHFFIQSIEKSAKYLMIYEYLFLYLQCIL